MTTQAQRNSYRRDAERRAAAAHVRSCPHCYGRGGAWVIRWMENNEPTEMRLHADTVTSNGQPPPFEVCPACNGTGRSAPPE